MSAERQMFGGVRRGTNLRDHRSAKRWVRGPLAVYYLVLAVANAVILTGTAQLIMVLLCAGTAAVLAITALWPPRPGRRTAEALVFLLVAVHVAQIAVTGNLHCTTLLMLSMVGVGGAVTSRWAAAGAWLFGCGGWVASVAVVPALRTPELAFYSTQILLAAMLGVILFEGLRRRQRQLRTARDELAATAQRFSSLFLASPTGVAIADGGGALVGVNPAFCELVGLTENELIGTSSAPYLKTSPGDPVTVCGIEQRYVRPDGSVRWAWLTSGAAGVGSGEPWTMIQLQDVTDRHLAEKAVRESDRLLAAVSAAARRIRTGENARGTIIAAVRDLAEADTVTLLEPCPDLSSLVVTDSDGAAIVGTRVPLDNTSMISRVYRSGDPIFLADPDQDPRVSPALLELVGGRSMHWQPVVVEGTPIAVLCVGWRRRVSSVSDHRARAVELLADETALAMDHERLLRRLEQMAFTDSLTGLPNRRAWQSSLSRLFGASSLVVAIVDLDHFKRYNDTYGHPAGDDLLRHAAAAFAAELREGDLIARWGGEEFVIALPGRDPEDAAGILDRVRRAMPRGQTCSIGYAAWDAVRDAAETPEGLLERADNALYAAKDAGRDRVQAAEPVALPI
ncbi:diguanylate cyclase [Actinoplanes sp. NPDC051851]|uniref:sensor domain-containing diguanylate cyclase n=1 Tax=Actinoplanes sp. NPDC051851 TaxID=3154753 RepID=UPI00342ACE03